MFSINDIENLCKLLQNSRDKAVNQGDYETALEEHDQVIRKCCKFQNLCEKNSQLIKKFEIIKEKCRYEMKLFSDILHQCNELKKGPNCGKGFDNLQQNELNSDPDVWAPPTPLPPSHQKRNTDENLPVWAKLAPTNQGNNPRHERRQSGEENNSRMRRKDPIPENRRRSLKLSLTLPYHIVEVQHQHQKKQKEILPHVLLVQVLALELQRLLQLLEMGKEIRKEILMRK